VRRSFGRYEAHSCGTLLIANGFDRFVEAVCQPCYAAMMGAPSLPPRRYFRMRMVGCFERDRQRTRHCLAVFGLAVAARFSAAGELGEGSRSFLALEGARAASS
jgi:hypothetical protein